MNNAIGQIEQSYIFFSIGTFNYAFDAKYVLDIMQLVELEYPESMPEYIVGLLEHNNQVIKIVDIRNILNLDPIEYNLNSKIIIVKTENDVFGFVIDEVREIKRVNVTTFNAPPYNSEKSYLQAIYTDKDVTSTVINIENVEKKINSRTEEYRLGKSASQFLPADLSSKETLHRRKLHYARKMREVSSLIIKNQDTYITFGLDDSTCCIKILHVSGFYKYANVKLTNVPCTPDFIVGVASIKGRYITIIDLLKFTEGKSTPITQDTSIVVVEYEDYEIGIITPAIGETIDFDENLLKFNQSTKVPCLNECVVNETMYLFLDIKKLFSDEKFYISW